MFVLSLNFCCCCYSVTIFWSLSKASTQRAKEINQLLIIQQTKSFPSTNIIMPYRIRPHKMYRNWVTVTLLTCFVHIHIYHIYITYTELCSEISYSSRVDTQFFLCHFSRYQLRMYTREIRAFLLFLAKKLLTK